jgi:NADPH:quinone reductase-like Zn-dependent oxidoreductase
MAADADGTSENIVLEVERGNVEVTRLVEEPVGALRTGEVRLRIDRFAVTANTITYGLMGDMLGYWDFYPAQAPWGRVPAMGWADVVDSANPDIAVGGRYFGWYPMARSVDVLVSASADGMRDRGPHREKHAGVYRTFTETTKDATPASTPDEEDRHALLRGLFATGYLADAFFADEDYFDADDIVVLSASSKTAIGFAQMAATRGRRTVGVTSAANADFVRSVGFYDDVVTYDGLDVLGGAGRTAVSIDMAGNTGVLARVHEAYGDRLRYSMMIGMSHHDTVPVEITAGPTPTLLFAPSEVARRTEQWGREAYQARLGEALAAFVEASQAWLTIERVNGAAAAQQAWADVYAGRIAPSVGEIVSLHDA